MKLKVSIFVILTALSLFLVSVLGIPKLSISEVPEFSKLAKDPQISDPAKLPNIKFTLFKTGEKKASAAFIFEGGPLFHRKPIYYSVVLVDRDPKLVGREIFRVHSLLQSHSNLEVVPAHDGEVLDKIGFYPNWTE